MKFPVFPPILAFFGGETRKNWEKGGLGGGLLAQTAFFSPCCPVYRSMRWLALFSSLLLALWTLPLPIANCRNLCYPISNASNGRPKGAVFETQAAHSLPDALVSWNRPRVEAFEVSLPRLTRKEGCRMTLTEILALVAVLISLLTLIATVVHDTFDIAWKIAEHRNTNGKKK